MHYLRKIFQTPILKQLAHYSVFWVIIQCTLVAGYQCL